MQIVDTRLPLMPELVYISVLGTKSEDTKVVSSTLISKWLIISLEKAADYVPHHYMLMVIKGGKKKLCCTYMITNFS